MTRVGQQKHLPGWSHLARTCFQAALSPLAIGLSIALTAAERPLIHVSTQVFAWRTQEQFSQCWTGLALHFAVFLWTGRSLHGLSEPDVAVRLQHCPSRKFRRSESKCPQTARIPPEV